MNRMLWEIASILFLVAAFAYAAIAVARGVPAALTSIFAQVFGFLGRVKKLA